jgi:hypothetical protein
MIADRHLTVGVDVADRYAAPRAVRICAGVNGSMSGGVAAGSSMR